MKINSFALKKKVVVDLDSLEWLIQLPLSAIETHVNNLKRFLVNIARYEIADKVFKTILAYRPKDFPQVLKWTLKVESVKERFIQG